MLHASELQTASGTVDLHEELVAVKHALEHELLEMKHAVEQLREKSRWELWSLQDGIRELKQFQNKHEQEWQAFVQHEKDQLKKIAEEFRASLEEGAAVKPALAAIEPEMIRAEFTELLEDRCSAKDQAKPMQEATDSEQQERDFSTGHLHVQRAPDAEKLQQERTLILQEIGFTQLKEEIGKIRDEFDKMKFQQAPNPQNIQEELQSALQEREQEQDIYPTSDAYATSQTRHTLNTPQELDGRVKHTYTLKGSMWDAVMLMCVPPLGPAGSINLGLVILLNVLVQSVFCAICWMAFKESNFDDDKTFGLKVWRWFSAHDVSHVNHQWPMSLASRVCEDDVSLILSGQQTQMVNLINEYRPKEMRFVGQLMCLVCLFCFWTRLWSEAQNTVKFMRAAITVSGKHTVLHASMEGIEFISISPFRKVFVAMIFVLRAVILVNLAVVVTIWLSRTTSLGELLLNALALELVLNVDDFLFEGFAPARAKALVENLLPLPIWHRDCNGADLAAILGISLMVVAVPSVYFSLLQETLGLVSQADTALCGGITNFAYNVDQLGIIYIHDQMATPSTQAFTEEGFDQTNPRIQALNNVIDGVPREEWRFAIHEPDLVSLKAKSAKDPSILQDELNRECKDLLVEGDSTNKAMPILMALRGATGNVSFDICSKENIEPYCYQTSVKADRVTQLARLLCPVSCGCTSGDSGTLVYSGCPRTCVNWFRKNLEALSHCKDIDWKSSAMWTKWMQEAELLVPGHIVARLKLNGCKALEEHPARNSLCEGKAEWSSLKPLSGICPESCGCRTELEGAPMSCPNSCSSMRCPKAICDRGLPGKNLDDDSSLCTCYKDAGDCYEEECSNQKVQEGCTATERCVWHPQSGECNCPCSVNTFAAQGCACGIDNICSQVPRHCYNSSGEQDDGGDLCYPPCAGSPEKTINRKCKCPRYECRTDAGCETEGGCHQPFCKSSRVFHHCLCGSTMCSEHGDGCYNDDGEQDDSGSCCDPNCIN